MLLPFYKYQGTGNDFILIDNRVSNFQLHQSQIKNLCDRRFGIGADGLMLLSNEKGFDFKMTYYNSDGNESTMCGNGGRCISMFAKDLRIVKTKAHFIAIDGEHFSEIDNDVVNLKMNDVTEVLSKDNFHFLNTGSPHYVTEVVNLDTYDVFKHGNNIRYSETYKPGGTNVNFIEFKNNQLFARTYERGVEDETYSCGTGVTACAIVSYLKKYTGTNCAVQTKGGMLWVSFETNDKQTFTNIHLKGAATFVFKGEINL